jgi:hypothetical protein
MEIILMEDRGTRVRQAYRAGWLSALRNRPNSSPKLGDAELDGRWSEGFGEGQRLRRSWQNKKPRTPNGFVGFFVHPSHRLVRFAWRTVTRLTMIGHARE